MSEAQQPVHDGAAAAPTANEPTAATTTATEATADPVRSQGTSELSPESRPELNTTGVTDGTTASQPTAPNVSNVTKEEKVGKGEVKVESHTINEGVLNYKGPGLKGLIPSKKYFWFSDAPLEHKHLSAYLGNEKSKDIGHANAAHAQQTGKGLLFFAKRAEDKEHPQGIFNLADVTDIAKGNFNNFSFTLHGHQHQLQAITKAEKDAWIVTLETKAAEAKTSREGIVGSSGYKNALEKYGAPAAAATTATSRSRSRPGKKASKSRERKVGETKADTTAAPTTTETTTTAPSDDAAKKSVDTPTEHHATGTSTGDKAGESAVGGAAVGAAAGTAAARSGSTSEEDKKTKKSRSQSRNKRGSLFGNLLSKKEDHDAKKEVKKEEKEEKKEEKSEEKAIKKDIKNEEKADKKEEKAEAKAEKSEVKQDTKDHKKFEQEANPLSTGQTPGFNAHDIASRVVGEPVLPAGGKSTGTDEISPAAGTGTAAAGPSTAETAPTSTTRETAPKPNKRSSIFGGFFGKKEAPTSAPAETSPTAPVKNEPSTVSPTAPQLDTPGTEPTSTAKPTTETTGTETAAAEPTTPGATTTPTDKRRSSFFSNLGTKKERKAGTTSGDELTDGEGKKQTSGGFGGLLRKASRAQKGNAAAKDPADVPLPKETPAAATTTEGAAEEKPTVTDSQVESNSKAAPQEQTPVSAAA
ncbi:hypothetical protein ACLMJK_004099 [Lecanora helva]